MPEKNLKNNCRFELLNMAPEFTNSVLVSCGDDCVIFDAWGRATDWVNLLRQRNLTLCAIYSTHGHPDHISAAPDLVLATGCKWFLSADDFNLIGWGDELLCGFGLPPITRGVLPEKLPTNSVQILPNLVMDIIKCPGHTAGGVSFYFASERILLVGDTLFADSVGRCDLPGGDEVELMQSVRALHDMNLPADTTVIPGHNDITTIARLRVENPYFRG